MYTALVLLTSAPSRVTGLLHTDHEKENYLESIDVLWFLSKFFLVGLLLPFNSFAMTGTCRTHLLYRSDRFILVVKGLRSVQRPAVQRKLMEQFLLWPPLP
ncbi:hypothetical protein FKM82_020038 [Ascaphus truei]